MKKEIDTSQALIAAHPFYFEWGTDNPCYLHVQIMLLQEVTFSITNQ